MKTSRWLALMGVVMLVAVLGSNTAAAAPPATCDMQLTVELTPDVPNPRDAGFLSSLLSNHVNYRLTLRRQNNSSVIVLDLTGPGPDYRCQNVVEAMGRDGRVRAVHMHAEPS
jgi:hypothetical protein